MRAEVIDHSSLMVQPGIQCPAAGKTGKSQSMYRNYAPQKSFGYSFRYSSHRRSISPVVDHAKVYIIRFNDFLYLKGVLKGNGKRFLGYSAWTSRFHEMCLSVPIEVVSFVQFPFGIGVIRMQTNHPRRCGAGWSMCRDACRAGLCAGLLS